MIADTFSLTNVNNVVCEASHAVCEGGCIYQSAEECSARSVDVAFNGDAVLAGNVACSSELVHYFPAPYVGNAESPSCCRSKSCYVCMLVMLRVPVAVGLSCVVFVCWKC